MSKNAQIMSSTSLTPAELERGKTRQQKAEDVIYTLNHAVTCLSITDTVGMTFAANTYKMFSGKDPSWKEESGVINWIKDKWNGVKPEKQEKRPFSERAGSFFKNTAHWLLAEMIGDLGAVPFTVGVQRLFPGFMNAIRSYAIEPIFGGMFKRNTLSAAKSWGEANGKEANSKEVVDYAQKLYEYEMHHLPQMALWTVSSVGINFGAMKVLSSRLLKVFEPVSTREFVVGKSIGAAITAGLVLAVRGLMPGGAHKWDESVGKHVIAPIAKKVGNVFGVKDEDFDQFNARDSLKAEAKPSTTLAPTSKAPATPLTVLSPATEKRVVEKAQKSMEMQLEARL